MQLIALGYLTHLLGDVYSHRTIVPKNVKFIDGSELKKNCFLLADFKNNYTEIQKGTTEYRALKNYAIDGLQDIIVSSRYIDNPKFYPARYHNAKFTTRKILLYAIDPIKRTAKFDYKMLIPTQEKNSKLSRLKTYVSVLGDTTQYEGSWRQVSAND